MIISEHYYSNKKMNISVLVTLSKVCEHIIKLVTKHKTQVKKRDMIKQKIYTPSLRRKEKNKKKTHTALKYRSMLEHECKFDNLQYKKINNKISL